MRMSDLLRMGLRNLSRRKARTALTVLGVVIGTISIVVMVSIGIGMNVNYQKSVMELGSLNQIRVTKYADVMNENGEYVDSVQQDLNDTLVEQLRALPHVKVVTPLKSASISMYAGKYQASSTLYGVDFDSLGALELPEPSYGTIPTGENPGTLILGGYIPNTFYNPSSFRYEPVVFDPEKMHLVYSVSDWEFEMEQGYKEKKTKAQDVVILQQTSGYQDTDYSIYMDMTSFMRAYQQMTKGMKKTDQKKAMAKLEKYDSIVLTADSVNHVEEVQDAIKEMGFQTSSLSSMMEPMQQTANMLQLVLGGIGAVAMLVSAISIANTMVMSIYERTKEIGVMKVLGCVVGDIRKLFLFEAGLIGLIGGVIGLAVSYLVSYLINRFGGPLFSAIMGTVGIGVESMKYSVIPIWLGLAAVAFAVLVGLVSGYYPANRATKISAIEAMRQE